MPAVILFSDNHVLGHLELALANLLPGVDVVLAEVSELVIKLGLS